MFGFGKKTYFLFTEDRTTGERKLNPQLTKEIKAILGTYSVLDREWNRPRIAGVGYRSSIGPLFVE